jgi:spore maturation protein CgeB
MKFVLFYHSFVSCWNHGNVHFLRGIARELIREGHSVTVYEPEDGWSRVNALADDGESTLAEAAAIVPDVKLETYRLDTLDIDKATARADVVIAHEWNPPALIAALGHRRTHGGRFILFFHDTHHRAITAGDEMARYELDGYDGVLAFGEVLRDIYERRGWGRAAFTWHEAADTTLFRPLPTARKETDLIWIGNWGDEERSRELDEFLVTPAARLKLRARVHGVRYPQAALAHLAAAGIDFTGWLANHRATEAFAQARFTLHVPRRPYTEALPGIPTIRVFEALASGIPLISAPWSDCEGLFPDGCYLKVRNGDEMTRAMMRMLHDHELAPELVRNGLAAIAARHTCAHRVRELSAILAALNARRFHERRPPLALGATPA